VDELKKEIEGQDDKGTPINWSAVLPVGNDGFVTLAKLPAAPGLLAHPNALLQFVQRRMPLEKALTKLGSDGIEGEKQIGIATVSFGPIAKSPDRRLDDNFPIAQFIDMKEDDLLGKPSFDSAPTWPTSSITKRSTSLRQPSRPSLPVSVSSHRPT
jgi:hypothetical protein